MIDNHHNGSLLYFTASQVIIPSPVIPKRNIIVITLNIDDSADLETIRTEFTDELKTVLDENGIQDVSIQFVDVSINNDDTK